VKEFSYYPGCSLHGTARDYDESVRGVMELLDIKLHELEDWSCCGASSAHCIDETLAVELAARNLAIAERSKHELLIPCVTCYSRFKAAEIEVKQHSRKVSFPYSGDVTVRFALDYLCTPEILQQVEQKCVKPLSGLKVVCYYGCLTVRPPKVTQVKDYENPQHMDRLMKQLGADPIPWSYKTDCCGASLMITRLDIVKRLLDRLLSEAKKTGADCVVVGCPMCQANLDTRQPELERELGKKYDLPILYYTELMGLAMGHPDAGKWFRRHIKDPFKLLNAKGLLN
jgi:heterodisulfide reductase subunit B